MTLGLSALRKFNAVQNSGIASNSVNVPLNISISYIFLLAVTFTILSTAVLLSLFFTHWILVVFEN
jgi:hypothetical protein